MELCEKQRASFYGAGARFLWLTPSPLCCVLHIHTVQQVTLPLHLEHSRAGMAVLEGMSWVLARSDGRMDGWIDGWMGE